MRQYLSIKAEHPGSVLLFRMGDFWETFWEDAALVSRVLGIVLTTRGVEKGEPIPLAGVPLASLEGSVAKLVAAGHRVAICDQVEDPREAKGIVKREVVEIVSAGTATLPGLLEERASRWLVAVFPDAPAGRVGLARCDVATGELVGAEVAAGSLGDELDRLAPAEILVPEGEIPAEVARAVKRDAPVAKLPAASFPAGDAAAERVRRGPGLAAPQGQAPLFLPLAVSAAAALLDYLETMKKAEAH